MSYPLVKAIVAERPVSTFGFCCYCGAPCTGRVCSAHTNVAMVDPHYQLSCKED